jgi:anti-sigma regulatory factor (Ser/Thr protein kinase)
MNILKVTDLEIKPNEGEITRAVSLLLEELKIYKKALNLPNRFNPFHFRLALDESLLNAKEHGCKHSDDGLIRVTVRFSPNVIEITVEDSGLGFSWEDLKIDNQKNFEAIIFRGLKKAKGWGLPIIQTVVQGFYWNSKGNRITMLLSK